MQAALAGESGIGGFPWHRDDYGERVITLPGDVDGHRSRRSATGWLSSSLSLSHADCHAMAVVLVVCRPDEVGA
jgi:phosphopantetheinyl transferase (holo-ACP synthase)